MTSRSRCFPIECRKRRIVFAAWRAVNGRGMEFFSAMSVTVLLLRSDDIPIDRRRRQKFLMPADPR